MMCTHPECCNLRELLLSYSRDGWQLYYWPAAPLHKVSGRRCVLTPGSMVYHLQMRRTFSWKMNEFWIEQLSVSHSGWTEDEELLLSCSCQFRMTLWKAWNLAFCLQSASKREADNKNVPFHILCPWTDQWICPSFNRSQISEQLLGFIKNALMSRRLTQLILVHVFVYHFPVILLIIHSSLCPITPSPWITLVPSRALLSNHWQSVAEVLYERATRRTAETRERSFPFPFWYDVGTLLLPLLLLFSPLLPGVQWKHQVRRRLLRSELSRSDAARGDAFKRHLLASSMKGSANNSRCVYKCSANLVAQL